MFHVKYTYILLLYKITRIRQVRVSYSNEAMESEFHLVIDTSHRFK